jgi:hypothetical protein
VSACITRLKADEVPIRIIISNFGIEFFSTVAAGKFDEAQIALFLQA